MSKSVTFIYISSFFQYFVVFVCSDIACLAILLCIVPSSSITFPIIFRVFLLLSCDIFLMPSSISVASFAPYMGDLSIARRARLLEMLYFSWISFSSLRGVHISPYWTYACMAPTIKFFDMHGVIPPPLSRYGTSCRFVFSAFLVGWLYEHYVSGLHRCTCPDTCSATFFIYAPLYIWVIHCN